MFKDTQGMPFIGIIQGVKHSGEIKILTENDRLKSFDLKGITMLY